MKADEVITQFKDEYGYVSDINGVTSFLKEKTNHDRKTTNEILVKIIEWNLKTEKENRELLQEKGKKETTIKEKLEEKEKQVEKQNETSSSLLDVTSYINALKECDDDDFLTEILPSIYDNNFDTIIGSILLYFYREISLANEMLQVETNEDDIEYLRSVTKRNREIINIIKEYTKEEETEELQEENKEVQNNKLIFLKKSNDSLFIDSDIDDIPTEEDVLPILEDLINGNITREKRFHNSDKLKEISAIRKRNSRIIFVRLENDTILVLGILVKRFQNTQPYRDMLESRAKTFKAQRDELKDKTDDLEFLKENEDIQKRIIETLKSRKKLVKGE